MDASYKSIHRAAVREALHAELQMAIAAIEEATHVAVNRVGMVSTYGSKADADSFGDGLHGYTVRAMTRDDKELQITHKVRVYRNPSR